MLPSLEECRNRIRTFDWKYPHSTFDEFWAYKLEVGTDGSILDSSHLNKTIGLLDEKLLRHPKWGLWWMGIPPVEEIERILRNIHSEYEIVRNITLGEGRIATEKNSQMPYPSCIPNLAESHTTAGVISPIVRRSLIL